MKIILWILLTSLLCAQLLGGEPWWKRLDSAKANKTLKWWQKLPCESVDRDNSVAKGADLGLSTEGLERPSLDLVGFALELTPLEGLDGAMEVVPLEKLDLASAHGPLEESEELVCRPRNPQDNSPKANLKPQRRFNSGQRRLKLKPTERARAEVPLRPVRAAELSRPDLVNHAVGKVSTRAWPKLVPQGVDLELGKVSLSPKSGVGHASEKQQKGLDVEVISSATNRSSHFQRYSTIKKRRLSIAKVNPILVRKNLQPQASLAAVSEQADEVAVGRRSFFSRLCSRLGFKPKKKQSDQASVKLLDSGKTKIAGHYRKKDARHGRSSTFRHRGSLE